MGKKKRKGKIRKKLLERRSAIPEQAYHQKSDQIISTLRTLSEFKAADVIHCYISINKRREVNTQPLIKAMLGAGKKVVVPITQMESGKLRHVLLRSFDDLTENKWGVLEPRGQQEEVVVEDLELVIVPMVGGDRYRNRIGYGKGFYDRFLAKTDCPKIGLLFETCLVENIPTEPFDVPLDALITEEQVIE